jgi:hypothetical protein
MKNRLINYFVGLLALSAVLTSCIKNEVKELGNAGTPRVRISEVPDNVQYFAPFSDIKNVNLITIRRDEVSQSDMSQPLTVKLTTVTDSVDAYNNAYGTSFEPLPDSLFSVITGKGVTRSGNVYTVTFDPHVSAVTIPIALNGAKWNPAHTYALYFKITDAGGKQIKSDHVESLAAVAIINKYDGRYKLDGAFYHPTQSPGYDQFTIEVELHTTGVNSVKLYVPDFGGYYAPGMFAGTLNAFGAQEPEFTIDPVTNKVTVQNAYSGAVTFYTMNPTYDSHYEPGPPQKIFASWGYNYSPGPTFNPAANREWKYELTYLGPR